MCVLLPGRVLIMSLHRTVVITLRTGACLITCLADVASCHSWHSLSTSDHILSRSLLLLACRSYFAPSFPVTASVRVDTMSIAILASWYKF